MIQAENQSNAEHTHQHVRRALQYLSKMRHLFQTAQFPPTRITHSSFC
jgi:hypothetical protein